MEKTGICFALAFLQLFSAFSEVFPHSFDASSDHLYGRGIRPADADRVRKAFYKFVRHFADSSLQDDQLIGLVGKIWLCFS